MKEYKISEKGIQILLKKYYLRIIIVLPICLTLIFLWSFWKKPIENCLFILITTLFIAVPFAIHIAIQNQIKELQSYLLTTTDTSIKRELRNIPKIDIALQDIKSIIKFQNGGISITGKDIQDVIFIPAHMNNAEEIETYLNSIKEIIVYIPKPAQKILNFSLPILLVFCGYGLYVLVIIAIIFLKNIFLIGSLITFYILFSIWKIWFIKDNKHTNTFQKIIFYFGKYLFLASMLILFAVKILHKPA